MFDEPFFVDFFEVTTFFVGVVFFGAGAFATFLVVVVVVGFVVVVVVGFVVVVVVGLVVVVVVGFVVVVVVALVVVVVAAVVVVVVVVVTPVPDQLPAVARPLAMIPGPPPIRVVSVAVMAVVPFSAKVKVEPVTFTTSVPKGNVSPKR